MGITGLIPFLERASKPVHISEFSGCTVAIDSYCWLHKGAFSCAEKLARGDSCNAYVHYCMKYINTLLAHNIKPIMVFDGRHLPAKADTEKKRRETRELNRRRAAELMRQDKPDQARTYLRRCIDITHEMALELMQECRARNIDCITAPYEADAQLAYLNLKNIAHIVITEDSDLLLFGCSKVLFKMDINGGGLLIEQDKLHLSMDIRAENFSIDKFRWMCILAGCDYLASLPGIGLAKACRFVKSTADPDIHRALSRLGSHLNMSLVVPLEYRNNFMAAEAMFRHQPVFDPIDRQIVPLTPLLPGAPPLPLPQKDVLSPEMALQLAYGNLDPFSMKVVDDWAPDKIQKKSTKTSSWMATAKASHVSIWSPDFRPSPFAFKAQKPAPVKHAITTGMEKEHQPIIKRQTVPSNEEMLISLREQFGDTLPPSKKVKTSEDEQIVDLKHSNPFSKKIVASNNLKFGALTKLSHFKKTEISENCVTLSRYFESSFQETETITNNGNPVDDSNTLLKDIQNFTSTPETKSNTSQQLEKFIKNSPVKNSLGKFETNKSSANKKSLFAVLVENNEETEEQESSGIISNTERKENLTSYSKTSGSMFKWAKSLEDRFGFINSQIQSSKAVTNEFRNPGKHCLEDAKVVTEDQKSRNPFRVCETKPAYSLGSQGSSCEEDSDSSPSSLITQVNSSPPMPTPIQCRHPGLSKKPVSRQQSLVNMFGFKQKSKLQR